MEKNSFHLCAFPFITKDLRDKKLLLKFILNFTYEQFFHLLLLIAFNDHFTALEFSKYTFTLTFKSAIIVAPLIDVPFQFVSF